MLHPLREDTISKVLGLIAHPSTSTAGKALLGKGNGSYLKVP